MGEEGEAMLLAGWQVGVLGMGTAGGMAECGEEGRTGTLSNAISVGLREEGEWGVGR